MPASITKEPEFHATVALFVFGTVASGERAHLAIAKGVDDPGLGFLGADVGRDGIGPTFAEVQVVEGIAIAVGMAIDLDADVGIGAHHCDEAVQFFEGGGAQLALVVIEKHVVDFLYPNG